MHQYQYASVDGIASLRGDTTGGDEIRSNASSNSQRQMIPLPEKIFNDSNSRYFVMKSYSNENIGRSLQHGVWATGPRNEKNLSMSFDSAPFVILIFSVNGSSRFSGYSLMTSRPGDSKGQRDVFSGTDGRQFPGRTFDIKWIRHHEVFFRDCEHITNSSNENKPVKIGRDGQELAQNAGRQLCELIEKIYQNSRLRQSLPVIEEYVPVDVSGLASVALGSTAPAASNTLGSDPCSQLTSAAAALTSRKRGADELPDSISKRIATGEDPSAIAGTAAHLPRVSPVGLAKLASLAAALKIPNTTSNATGDTATAASPSHRFDHLTLTETEGSSSNLGAVIGSLPPHSAMQASVNPSEEARMIAALTDDVKEEGGDVWTLEDAVRENKGLLLFPIDLTNMSYDEYLAVHKEALRQRQKCESEGRSWPKFQTDDWLRMQSLWFDGNHVEFLRSEATGGLVIDNQLVVDWLREKFHTEETTGVEAAGSLKSEEDQPMVAVKHEES